MSASISFALEDAPMQVELIPKKERKIVKEGSSGGIFAILDEEGEPTLCGKYFKQSWSKNWVKILQEISALHALNHPNIIRPRKVIVEVSPETKVSNKDIPETKEITKLSNKDFPNTYITLVLPAGRMNLDEWIDSYYDSALVPALMYQIISAVAYMHARGFMHCDLKPNNIILFTGGEDIPLCQLADFDLAIFGVSSERKEKRSIWTITIWYRSPELLVPFIRTSEPTERVEYDFSADMWSLGVIFYRLLTRHHLFTSVKETEMVIQLGEAFDAKGYLREPYTRAFMHAKTKKRYAHITDEALNLFNSLLRLNPEERISARDALRHPYFRDEYVCESIRCFGIPLTDKGGGKDNVFTKKAVFLANAPLRMKIGIASKRLEQSAFTCDLALSLFERMHITGQMEEKDLSIYALACMHIAHKVVGYTYTTREEFIMMAPLFGIKHSYECFLEIIWRVIVTLKFQMYAPFYVQEV